MRSQAQIEASRLNGAKSKGPVTEEGKAISARNSYKTGMYSSYSCLLPDDDKEQFEEVREIYYETYRPEGWEEIEIVENIVRDKWRVRRAAYAEAMLQAPTHDSSLAYFNLHRSSALNRVHRHIAQLDKSVVSLVKQLKDLRAEKKKEERESENLQNEPEKEETGLSVDSQPELKSGKSMGQIVQLINQTANEFHSPKRTQDVPIPTFCDPELTHTPSKNLPNQ